MQPFIIPINGLKPGRTVYEWHSDGAFFGNFENSEIKEADLRVEATVEKNGHKVLIDCEIVGEVTVLCDRCLEDLSIPIETLAKLRLESSDFVEDTPEREVIELPEDSQDLDLSQVIYDYVCVSLPLQKIHPEGECNPDTVKYLSSENEEEVSESVSESPFAALKTLLK